MLMFTRSELYKMLHRKCTYVFFLFFVGGGFFLNLLLKLAAPAENRPKLKNDMMEFWLEIMLIFGWFLVYMIAQIIHSNEGKIGVMKNSVAFGINRTKIYVGRFMAQIILLVVSIVTIAGAVLLGNLVFNGACDHAIFMDFLKITGLMSVLWLGTLSVAHAFAMCFSSNTLSTVIYMLYFLFGPNIIQMAHMALPNSAIFTFLNKYEVYIFALNTVKTNKVDENIGLFFIIGGVYLVVSFAVGLCLYRRKEIK